MSRSDYSLRVSNYFRRKALKNVEEIERLTELMFHVSHPDLMDEMQDAMKEDKTNLYRQFKYKTDKVIDRLEIVKLTIENKV